MGALANWFFALARRILFFWVRTDVVPENPIELGLDTSQPVVYVLREMSLSDRLVMEQECLRAGMPSSQDRLPLGDRHLSRRFLFLTERRGDWFTRRQIPAMKGRLSTLVKACLDDPDLDIQLVPVSIFWGRSPDKENNLLKLLLSDNWAVSGRIRQFLAILVHGRHTFVQFNAPMSLQELCRNASGQAAATRKTARVLRVHFRRVRQAVIGPDHSHRRTLVNSLVGTTAVQNAIRKAVEQDGLSPEQARGKALKYANEISSNISIPTVRIINIALNWLWEKIYDGVTVNNLPAVARAAQEGSIVYVPCHRSHIDYLLLSYVLYHNGLMIPHVAAGVNLNIPIVGGLLRRGGAFFLRRSFKDNRLYAAVFNEYLHTMFSKGYPIEYFVEGGRSRTGRTLHPRGGMLVMTIRSYLRNSKKPLVFVPVYFGYEKILEERAYLGELRGKRKQKESIGSLLKAIRNLKNHGRVAVTFGQPFALDHLLERFDPAWKEKTYGEGQWPEWLPESVDALAEDVATSINSAAALNPVNVVASILLGRPRHSMDAELLGSTCSALAGLLQQRPYSAQVTYPEGDGDSWVAYLETMGSLQRQPQALGDIMTLDDTDAVLMTYYRNNTLHLLALPAFVAALLFNHGKLSEARFRRLFDSLYPYLRSELFLAWNADEAWSEVAAWLDIFSAEGLVSRSGQELFIAQTDTGEWVLLGILARLLLPTLERYYITFALLQRGGSGKLSADELEGMSTQMAERLAMLHGLNAPEFFDKSLFRKLIGRLEQEKVLHRNDQNKLTFDGRLEKMTEETRQLLSSELRRSILKVTLELRSD